MSGGLRYLGGSLCLSQIVRRVTTLGLEVAVGVVLSAGDRDRLSAVNGAPHHVHQLDSSDRLLLKEEVNDGVERSTTLREDRVRPLAGFGEDVTDFLVDDKLGPFGIGAALGWLETQVGRSSRSEADGPQPSRETPVPDHPRRQLSRPREIIGRAG